MIIILSMTILIFLSLINTYIVANSVALFNGSLIYFQIICIISGILTGILIYKTNKFNKYFIAVISVFAVILIIKSFNFGCILFFTKNKINYFSLITITGIFIFYTFLNNKNSVLIFISYLLINVLYFNLHAYGDVMIFNLMMIPFILKRNNIQMKIILPLIPIYLLYFFYGNAIRKAVQVYYYAHYKDTTGYTTSLNMEILNKSDWFGNGLSNFKFPEIIGADSVLYILKKFPFVITGFSFGYLTLILIMVVFTVFVFYSYERINLYNTNLLNKIILGYLSISFYLGYIRTLNLMLFIPSYEIPLLGFGVNSIFLSIILISLMLKNHSSVLESVKFNKKYIYNCDNENGR